VKNNALGMKMNRIKGVAQFIDFNF